jgi:ketosteroid isomerase-like protein
MNTTAYATPEAAEQAFYDAFQAGDIAAMMDVWADGDFIECIHPMSDRSHGRSDIAAGWREIFSSGLRVQIRRSGIRCTQDALLAIHILYEHFSVQGRKEQVPPVIATNIYQFVAGSWRMVLHHASPSARGDLQQPHTVRRPHDDKHQLH